MYILEYAVYFTHPYMKQVCLLSTLFGYMIETVEHLTNNGLLYGHLIPNELPCNILECILYIENIFFCMP